MSLRRLRVLLRQLPVDSALGRAANGAGSTTEQIGLAQLDLMASQLELTHEHMRITMAAAGVKPHDLPPPLRLPRSGQPAPDPVDTAPVVPPTDPHAITRQLMTALGREV